MRRRWIEADMMSVGLLTAFRDAGDSSVLTRVSLSCVNHALACEQMDDCCLDFGGWCMHLRLPCDLQHQLIPGGARSQDL